jgi:C4-dicarboxylate transporter, DctM subunit
MVLLGLTVLLPLVQVVARLFSIPGIRGSSDYIQHLVLWTAFAGGAITTREGQHLALTIGVQRFPERLRAAVNVATSGVTLFFLSVLTVASLSFALNGFLPGASAGILPIWILALVMPAGFALMTGRFLLRSSASWKGRCAAAIGILLGLLMAAGPLSEVFTAVWGAGGIAAFLQRLSAAVAPFFNAAYFPLLAILILSVLLGAPIFILLGGLAILFFFGSGGYLSVIPNEAYVVLATNPFIPAFPLFTLAGYIISESRAGERLVRLFKALCGWLPGGLPLMAIIVCAFFTTFTGASGVTILAVGGLLFFILSEAKYRERFSTGLLTASGSIGLLFPPSLPVILYGVMAKVDVRKMFVGGILPGILLVLTLAGVGVFRSLRDKVPRVPFNPKEALKSFPAAAFEVALPVLILVFFFMGVMTLLETAAFSVLYALVLETIVHRDIPLKKLPEIGVKSVVVMGGVLTIIGMAYGLQYYITDAQIPDALAAWLSKAVTSKYVFMALLNVALLIVGCFMDIYSAIAVVVPLIVPIAATYGIDSVHLGIIFLANLELGYLTPPVGLNLYLASYRFTQPLSTIIRRSAPFLLIMLLAVLLITYVPWLTTALLGVFKF